MLELNAFLQGDVKEDGEHVPDSDIKSLTISPGFGWSNDKIRTLFVYQRAIAGTNVDVNDSFVLTFVYTF